LQRQQRRLAAILAADVAGYSRLMAVDEAGTLARLKQLRAEVIEPAVSQFGGQIVGSAGDSLLIEFASAVDAVQCAAEMQQSLAVRNTPLSEERRMAFRMGVNLGDVIVEGGTIYGDGVNIAARLEKLAEPGGICIARSVYEQIRGKLPLTYSDLGPQAFHNIPEPVQAYRILTATASKPAQTLSLRDKPSIAVLPFANMSGDPDQQYFSDGITSDIIDRLSKYRILSVIGQPSLALRGRGAGELDIRSKPSADYVLSGNIRKSENRIRIAARLSDAKTEGTLWADHYDRPLQDIFAIQDEVANIIASTLMGRVEIEVATRTPATSPASISSYEYVLRGIWHFKKLAPAEAAIAASYFQKAIAAYPENAEAHRWLSSCHVDSWLLDFSREQLSEGLRAAARAVELDPANAVCHTALGFCQLWGEGLDAATRTYQKAYSLNPGDPNVLTEMGLLHAYLGNLPASYEFFDRASRMNPLPPLWYAEYRSIAAFVGGRYAEALPAFLAIPDYGFDAMYAMACLGHLEDRERAVACRSRFQNAGRKWDLLAGANTEPYRDPEPRLRLIAGLKKALDF
jgi:adenylate cyclase